MKKTAATRSRRKSKDLKAMAASPGVRRSLPVDVIQEEILMRLPVKDVVRCKLLSREYNDLIKNPSFIKKHLLFRQSRPTNNKIVVTVPVVGKKKKSRGHIMSVFSSSSSDVVYVPYPVRSHSIQILGSCNGLLCGSMLPSRDINRRLLLWNPATRDHTILPILHQPLEAVGFGYDAVTGDYKLVTFPRHPPFRGVKLWSLSTNCWIDLGDMPKFLDSFVLERDHCYGMLLQHTNKLYWLATDYYIGGNVGDGFIFSFDIGNYTFEQIMLPSVITSQRQEYIDIIDNMGSLALSTTIRYNGGDLGKILLVDIWVMDDDKNWAKRFSFESPSDFCYQVRFSVGDMLLVLEDLNECIFILYDPLTKQEKERYSCPGRLKKPWNYNESLVSIR